MDRFNLFFLYFWGDLTMPKRCAASVRSFCRRNHVEISHGDPVREKTLFLMVFALFAGIGDLCLGLTLKKPKENQCFWLRALKNLKKINVFALPEHLVDPGVTIGLIVKIYIHKLPIHRMHAAD